MSPAFRLPFTESQENALLGLSIFGLVGPNGAFVYFALAQPSLVMAALANPIAMVFMTEAFFLMLLVALLIHRAGIRSPGPIRFILLSLLGSLAFSVPWLLYRLSRNARQSTGSSTQSQA